MENNHEVTNEELARMIAKGFEGTAQKVDMDRQFGEVKERLERIEISLRFQCLDLQKSPFRRFFGKIKK